MRRIPIIAFSLCLLLGCNNKPKDGYYDSETGVTVNYGKPTDKFGTPTKLLTPGESGSQKDRADAHNYISGLPVGKDPAFYKAKLKEGAAKFGKDREYRLAYAMYLLQHGEAAASLKDLKAFAKEKPEDKDVEACLAFALAETGDMNAAKPHFETVQTTELSVESAMLTNGQMYLMLSFAQYAVGPENQREKALHNLLISFPSGQVIPDFDFKPYMAEAKKDNHSELAWLPKLALVCQGKAKADTLKDWEAAQHAKKPIKR